MKFRKKPIVIEAIQFTYPPTEELLAFCGRSMVNVMKERHMGAIGTAQIFTLEDGMGKGSIRHVASEGDWIIKGVQGEFYPCKPGIFDRTYEQVNK